METKTYTIMDFLTDQPDGTILLDANGCNQHTSHIAKEGSTFTFKRANGNTEQYVAVLEPGKSGYLRLTPTHPQ